MNENAKEQLLELILKCKRSYWYEQVVLKRTFKEYQLMYIYTANEYYFIVGKEKCYYGYKDYGKYHLAELPEDLSAVLLLKAH